MAHSFFRLTHFMGKRAPKMFAGTLVYLLCFTLVFSGIFLPSTGRAQVIGLDPLSLKEVPVPEPMAAFRATPIPGSQTNLNFQPLTAQFVKDQAALIRLGKALFWDMQTGSDGIMACASCHYNAGVDNRAKNQVSPGLGDTNFPGGDKIFGNSTVPFTANDPNNPAGPLTPPNPLFNVPGKPGFGPNYQLAQGDFSLNGWFNPTAEVPRGLGVDIFEELALVDGDTNDVIGSQGVRNTQFTGLAPPPGNVDAGTPLADIFNVVTPGVPNLNGRVRRVTGRQAPPTINAAFNFDNFWDGRASFIFNGVNPFGFRDRTSTLKRTVLVGGVPTLQNAFVRILNSSLASQAVGPPLSDVEMSWAGRSFPDLGKKLLALRPLGKQLVHPTDSVLGSMARGTLDPQGNVVGLKGLRTLTYANMVRAAFKPQWYNSTDIIVVNTATAAVQKASTNDPRNMVVSPGKATVVKADQVQSLALNPMAVQYTQMEYNFSLFWGLAVQAYERTLISDDAPYDRFVGSPKPIDRATGAVLPAIPPDPNALTFQERVGLSLFLDANEDLDPANGTLCSNCHIVPITSGHTVLDFGPDAQGVPSSLDAGIELMVMGDGVTANYDHGMYNISVRRTKEDLGRAGTAPNAAPFLNPLDGNKPFPLSLVDLTALKSQGKLPPDVARFIPTMPILPRRVSSGAFKVPNLRNSLYTGPYFHNGDSATLRHVVEFYARGGNFPNTNFRDLTEGMNGIPILQFPEFIPNAKTNIEALVAFLANGFTDPRVAFERAPFDHPQLFIPEGANAGNPDVDLMLTLPPVGSAGRATPIPTFLNLDPQDAGP